MKFTGHERDLHSLAGTGDDLDYMLARFCSPVTGRFLSVDPVRGRSNAPQSWNRYSYVMGNPLTLLDPSGESGLRFLIKGAQGVYRYAQRRAAVRAAAKRAHAVKVEGPGASREARRIAREASPDKRIVRHDPHRPGDLPHYQPTSGGKGHVAYEITRSLLLGGASVGTVVGNAWATATGSERVGVVVAETLDSLSLPETTGSVTLHLRQLQELRKLFEIFTGSSSETAEEHEEEGGDQDVHGSVFGERVECERGQAGAKGANYCS